MLTLISINSKFVKLANFPICYSWRIWKIVEFKKFKNLEN